MLVLKSFLVSGLVEGYRIKANFIALSPNGAVKVFQQKYPKAKYDIFEGVLTGFMKKNSFGSEDNPLRDNF